MLDQFLWVIYPYLVLVLFIGGHIVRYNVDQFGWSTKSSEILEKKELRWGSLLFHWGIIFVFIGHVIGILIPEHFFSTIGISNETYHFAAVVFGLPAGLIAAIGLLILMHRRLSNKRIRLISSTSDLAALVLVGIAILSGLASTLLNINSNGFDYRTTIAPWLRGLITFTVDPSLMNTVPLWFKVHIFSVLTLFAVWPSTRLVHIFSFPLRYLKRSYIIYRKRSAYAISNKQ